MQIQIINVEQIAHPTKVAGKTTPKLDISYKNLSFKGQVEGKQLFSFGTQAEAFKVLSNAQKGEVYDLIREKNGAYQDWVSAKKSDGSATTQGSSVPQSPAASAYAPSKAPSTGGSTYATAEERAKVQIYIVRQSNITAAINLLSVGAKAPPSIDAIITAARRFEDHVFGNSNDPVDSAKPAIEKPVNGDIPDDDIPF